MDEKAVELKREIVAGQERAWNPTRSLQREKFEFAEIAWIKAAIQTWESYCAAVDRRWLLPLLLALSPQTEMNCIRLATPERAIKQRFKEARRSPASHSTFDRQAVVPLPSCQPGPFHYVPYVEWCLWRKWVDILLASIPPTV